MIESTDKKNFKKFIDNENKALIVAGTRGCGFTGEKLDIDTALSMMINNYIKVVCDNDLNEFGKTLRVIFEYMILTKDKDIKNTLDFLNAVKKMSKSDYKEKINKIDEFTEKYLKDVKELI